MSVLAGGVLGPLSAPLMAAPSPLPLGYAPRPPIPGTRFGVTVGVPTQTSPGPVVDIPDPHIERLIPGWMRNFWTAGSLIPRMMGDHLMDGPAPESDVQAPFPRPEDRSGGLGWYVGPPQLEEELERSTRPSDVRILKTVSDNGAAGKDVASPRLAPENPADTEGCDEEWAQARRDCEKGMSGPRGQGPYSTPLGPRGRRYTVEDCMSNNVRAICGGTPLRDGLSGQEAAKRNNDAIQKKRNGGRSSR